MLWLGLHLEIYHHEPAVYPGKHTDTRLHCSSAKVTQQCHEQTVTKKQTAYLLMLLEQVIQVVTPLVVKIKVFALRLTFGAHHFGNGCPVSAVLNEP